MNAPTIEAIQEAISAMDPSLNATDDAFKTAVLMMSGVFIGTGNLRKLAAFTRLPRSFIAIRAERLRKARIWTRDGKTAAEWFEEESGEGAIAFWMDCAVAEGFLER